MIKLKNSLINSLAEHFHSKNPEVVCGAILGYHSGEDVIIDSLIKLENENYELRNLRYLISPSQYEFAENAAREMGLSLIGFYHSAESDEPGEYDKKHALPDFVYLLFNAKRTSQINFSAWKLQPEKKLLEKEAVEIFHEESIIYQQAAIAV